MFQPQAEMQGIEFSFKTVEASILAKPELSAINQKTLVKKELPETLVGDELRLKQILINLIKNAIKFTRTGYVRIMTGFDDTCDRLIVVVADSGLGITQEEMP